MAQGDKVNSWMMGANIAAVLLLDLDLDRHVTEGIKAWLAAAAAVLALAWALLPARLRMGLLVLLVLLSACNYMRWGPDLLLKRVDSYDLIHYYLGARYFEELGYYDLYPAMILADREADPFSARLRMYRAQDAENGYRRQPILHALQRGQQVRQSRFTEARWAAFEHDFIYLQRQFHLTPGLWHTLADDRGLNATPVWLALARPLASRVPVEQVKWLCAADLFLLLAALLLVAASYGTTTALWASLFLLLSYSLRWPTVSWAFFRYDWVVLLMVCMCALKRGHPLFAGAALGLSTCLRLFPAAWLFGPASRAAGQALRHRRLFADRAGLSLLTGFVLALVLLQGMAAATLGSDTIVEHTQNITQHVDPGELSSRRLGFAIGMVYDGGLEPRNLPDESRERVAQQTPLRLALAVLALLSLGWGVRNWPQDRAFAVGFIPFFLLATASYYYAVARITLVLLHASRLQQGSQRVGLAALFGLETFCNWAQYTWPGHRVFLIGYLSWGLTLYTLFLLWLCWRERATHAGD